MKRTLLIMAAAFSLSHISLASQSQDVSPYIVARYLASNGKTVVAVKTTQSPKRPSNIAPNIVRSLPATAVTLDVPAFDWTYGSSITSAGMLFGYYDRNGYPYFYTGPTNDGVCPLTNAVWGHSTYGSVTSGNCPIVASKKGIDSRTDNGHVDDYWKALDSTADPYFSGGWTQHSPLDCAADFMGANQYQNWNNIDGATTFRYYSDGTPYYDPSDESYERDGTHGMKLFAEYCGYTCPDTGVFNQLIDTYQPGGFTFAQYMDEIDAGRPVLIQVSGNTMLGVGYDESTKTVYLHDTWDYETHAMTWGGSYSGMRHYMVSVFALAAPSPRVVFTAGKGGVIEGTKTQIGDPGFTTKSVAAVPNDKFVFVNWTLDGDEYSTDNPLTIANVQKNMAVTANFKALPYVTFFANSGGSIEGKTIQTGDYGFTTSPVTAVPNTGWYFTNWSGSVSSTDNPIVVANVQGPMNIYANFAIKTFTLVYTAGLGGTLSGETAQTVNYGGAGDSVMAVPDTGYHFASWSDGSTVNPRVDTNVVANVSVVAAFALNTYTLVYAAGSNGKIAGLTAQTVSHGAAGAAVTAIPDIGYRFLSWSDGSTANPRIDQNVTANIAVTASFAPDSGCTVAFLAGANGSVSGTTVQLVEKGGACSAVTAVPDANYRFVSWSGDYAGTDNPLTVGNVTTNMTITANFAYGVLRQVTFVAGAGGSISGKASQSVVDGENCAAVEAVAARGYEFTTWDNGFGATNPLTVTNVTSDLTITATFAKKAKPEYWVAYGSVFTVNASDLEDSSAFAKAPKVVSSGRRQGESPGLQERLGLGELRLARQGQNRHLRIAGERRDLDGGVRGGEPERLRRYPDARHWRGQRQDHRDGQLLRLDLPESDDGMAG